MNNLNKDIEIKKIDLELEKIKFLQRGDNTNYFLRSLGLFFTISAAGFASLFSLGKREYVLTFGVIVLGLAALLIILSNITIMLYSKEMKKLASNISNNKNTNSLTGRLEELKIKLNKKS